MVVLTRDEALPRLRNVVVALVTRTIHGVETEVELGPADASAAIAARVPLAAIADGERTGQARARQELGSEMLRRVERAARRRREVEREYEEAVIRAAARGRDRHAFCVRLLSRLTVTPGVSTVDGQIAVSGIRSPKWMRNAVSAELQL